MRHNYFERRVERKSQEAAKKAAKEAAKKAAKKATYNIINIMLKNKNDVKTISKNTNIPIKDIEEYKNTGKIPQH